MTCRLFVQSIRQSDSLMDPVDKIFISSVTRGDVTKKGNFNTNFGINDGKFDVLWNNTEDVNSNGSLFVLNLKAKTKFMGSAAIKITFSQPDTFNEEYKDVKLSCENITVKYSANAVSENTTKTDNQTTTGKSSVSQITANDAQIVEAVNKALSDNKISNLSEIKDKDKFVKSVNKNLDDATGKSNNISDISALKDMYTNSYISQFIKNVQGNISDKKVYTIIQKQLQKYGVNSISNLKKENQKEFVVAVQTQLQNSYSGIPNISEDLSVENALKAINQLYYVVNSNNQYTPDNTGNDYSLLKIIIIIAVVLVVCAVTLIICLKSKKRKIH